MANYNKKKRKGLAAILVMAIVIVLGGGTAFAYPYLETAYSPKAQVLAALQTAGEESKQGMQTMISEVSDLLTGQTQLTGNVTFIPELQYGDQPDDDLRQRVFKM